MYVARRRSWDPATRLASTQIFPSPSLGPPWLSLSSSPPPFCGIGLLVVVVCVGGGGACVVVWVVVGGGGGGAVVVVVGGGTGGVAVVVGAGAGGLGFLWALWWALCFAGFTTAAAVVVELVVVVVVLFVLDVLELLPQPASASAPATDSDANIFRGIGVRFPLGGISW